MLLDELVNWPQNMPNEPPAACTHLMLTVVLSNMIRDVLRAVSVFRSLEYYLFDPATSPEAAKI